MTSCSSLKSKRVNKQLAGKIHSSKVFNQYFLGFQLYDLENKRSVYEVNSHKYFTPASNTKVFTLYASLRFLADSLKAFHYKVKSDSLFLWGTGDPSFLHPSLPKNPYVLSFLDSFEGPIIFSNSNYSNQRFGPGWAWDDFPYYFSAETSAMPIYGNYISIKNDAPFGMVISPGPFKDSIRFVYSEKELANNPFNRNESSNQVNIPLLSPGAEKKIPIHFQKHLLQKLLSDTLHKNIFQESLPYDTTSQFIYSIPKDSVLKTMMHESDNFMAEQLLLMVGDEKLHDLNTAATIAYVKNELFQDYPDELIWKDGSGLSRYNLFTPATMVKLLADLYHHYPEKRLFHLFPAGGLQGTIENWYKSINENTPYIFAKTGTMSNNHCLSGYIIANSGKRFAFSFMHNNYPFGSSKTKGPMTTILEFIRDNY